MEEDEEKHPEKMGRTIHFHVSTTGKNWMREADTALLGE